MTLDELLQKMDDFDSGVNITIEEVQAAAKSLEMKVDDYKERMDFLEARVLVMAARIAEFQKAKKELENARKNIGKLMIWNMQFHQFDKLAGVDYKVKLGSRKDVEITMLRDPTEFDYEMFATFVKRSYTWQLMPIKDAVKKDPSTWAGFGKPVERPQLYWSVNKDGK